MGWGWGGGGGGGGGASTTLFITMIHYLYTEYLTLVMYNVI